VQQFRPAAAMEIRAWPGPLLPPIEAGPQYSELTTRRGSGFFVLSAEHRPLPRVDLRLPSSAGGR